MQKLLLIVEGEGDASAAPILVRRVMAELFGVYDLLIEVQRRRDINHLRANDWAHFKRYVQAAFYEGCPILWLLDADDECPVALAGTMYQIVESIGVRQPFSVGFWVREYETMFLYDKKMLVHFLGDKVKIDVGDPEMIRGAKEWLSSKLPRGEIYKARVDQSRLTAMVNLQALKASYRSFQHFEKVLNWLLSHNQPVVYKGYP
jgi:hypothetical protein